MPPKDASPRSTDSLETAKRRVLMSLALEAQDIQSLVKGTLAESTFNRPDLAETLIGILVSDRLIRAVHPTHPLELLLPPRYQLTMHGMRLLRSILRSTPLLQTDKITPHRVRGETLFDRAVRLAAKGVPVG